MRASDKTARLNENTLQGQARAQARRSSFTLNVLIPAILVLTAANALAVDSQFVAGAFNGNWTVYLNSDEFSGGMIIFKQLADADGVTKLNSLKHGFAEGACPGTDEKREFYSGQYDYSGGGIVYACTNGSRLVGRFQDNEGLAGEFTILETRTEGQPSFAGTFSVDNLEVDPHEEGPIGGDQEIEGRYKDGGIATPLAKVAADAVTLLSATPMPGTPVDPSGMTAFAAQVEYQLNGRKNGLVQLALFDTGKVTTVFNSGLIAMSPNVPVALGDAKKQMQFTIPASAIPAGTTGLSLRARILSSGGTVVYAQSLEKFDYPLGAVALHVLPAALSFEAASGGAPPVPQIVSVTADAAGQHLLTSVTTATGGDWLTVDASGAQTPGFLEVSASAAKLAAGTYTGMIMVGGSIKIPVTFQVGAMKAAEPGSEPRAVSAAVPHGTAAFVRSVLLVNRGSGQFGYTAAVDLLSGTGWLGIASTSGTVTAEEPARIGVTLDPSKLGAGTYRGRIRVTTTASQDVFDIPVTLAVSSGADAMVLSQAGLGFAALQGGGQPAAQEIYVAAIGAMGFNWTATASVDAGLPAWLTLSNTAGAASPGTPSKLGVQVNPTGLVAGHYYGEVQVAAAGVENSPRLLFVTLDVLAANAALPTTLEPSGLLFTAKAGAANPAAQNLVVRNNGGAALTLAVQVAGDASLWSATLPQEVSVAPGGTKSIMVSSKSAGLAAGIYTAELVVQTGAERPVVVASLVLVVSPAAAAERSAGSEPRTAAPACPPGGLAIVPLNVGPGFQTADNTPLPLELRVVNQQGAPLTAGSVSASFRGASTGTRELVHIGSDPGRWSGTLLPPSQSNPSLAIQIYAEDAAGAVTGCLEISGTVANTGAPVIPEGGIVSPASFAGGNPVSPGGMVAIFGTGLAVGSNAAQALPLPSLLGSTRAAMGGQPLALFYAGDQGSYSQINGILPYKLAANVQHQLILRRDSQAAYAEIILADALPGLFTVSQAGTGQAVAVHGANPGVLVDAQNPAAPGEVIVIYLEGLGAVDNTITAGQQTPLSPLTMATLPIAVTIGGQPAEVYFAGLVPGLAGLYQLNVGVPAGSMLGDAVSVVVTAGGGQSAPVTIAVR